MFGSFANVCIYRIPNNKQVVTGRSKCTKCKKIIPWYYNVPIISYLILNGKCKYCKSLISFQYCIVEFLTGISFLLIFLNYKNYFEILFLVIFVIIFIIIFFIDIKHFIIPNELNYLLILISFLKNFSSNFKSNLTYDHIESLIGGIVGYLSIWSIIFIYKKIKNVEAMGLGDAKFMIIVGLLFGWKSIPAILFCSAILGLIFVAPSLLNKTKNLKTMIPFGPFLIIATIIYYFSGNFLF